MPRRLRFALAARRDFAAIGRWYRQPGAGERAARRLQRIAAAIEALTIMPCSYAIGFEPGTRELICEGHRVIFRVNRDTGDNATAGDVMVLRVFGPGQQAN